MDIQLADAVSEELPSGLNDALSVRNWQMKIDDARSKLKSVYPKIKL